DEADGRRRISALVKTSFTQGWSFARWARWATPAAALLVMGMGIAVWIAGSQPSLSSTNQMIAHAYTQRRPFMLRFARAHHAPVRQKRGGPESRLDQPPELLDAEAQV